MGNKSSSSSFKEAVSANNVKDLRRLLQKSAHQLSNCDNVVFWAVSYGHLEIVQLLLDLKVDFNVRCDINFEELHTALPSASAQTSFLWSPLHEICR